MTRTDRGAKAAWRRRSIQVWSSYRWDRSPRWAQRRDSSRKANPEACLRAWIPPSPRRAAGSNTCLRILMKLGSVGPAASTWMAIEGSYYIKRHFPIPSIGPTLGPLEVLGRGLALGFIVAAIYLLV